MKCVVFMCQKMEEAISTDPVWETAQLSLQLVQCGKLFSFVWSGWEAEFN